MNNKMLHRGLMTRLTSTDTTVSVLSTCILLLIQFQTFHALPTSASLSANSDSRQQDTVSNVRASLRSTAYGSAYPYSSYRPGARLEDSYRPYKTYSEFPDSSSSSSGLYAPEALHPNSVYSRQSSSESSFSLSQNLDKVLKLVEKEIAASASDLKQPQQHNDKPISFTVKPNDGTPEEKQISLPLANNNNNNNTPTRSNKPRLLPLPSVPSPSSTQASITDTKQQQNINDNEQQPQQLATVSTFSALRDERQYPAYSPPPFAPELDSQYETRRQYGLGALSLLDQAGPYW